MKFSPLKFPIVLVMSVLLFAVSCSKDDDETVECTPDVWDSSLKISVAADVNGSALALGSEYTLNDGNKLRLDRFKFFLSNITLVKADGSETMVKDVMLVDYDLTPPTNPALPNWTNEFTLEVPAGEFTAIKFDLGVQKELNETDPAAYASDHPLSITTGNMYWSWATMYKFVVLEGKADVGSGSFDESVVFHTGTDPLYRSVSSISGDFTTQSGGTTNLSISLDVESLFEGPGGSISIATSPTSHSQQGAKFELAKTFTENMVEAFGK